MQRARRKSKSATRVIFLRDGLSRSNQLQLRAYLAALFDVDRSAAVFVLGKKFGIEVSPSVDLLPGEERVVSRNNIPHRKSTRLVCDRLPVIIRFASILAVRHEHDRNASDELI